MAATLTIPPRPLTHSGNRHLIQLQTDLGSPNRAQFTLAFFAIGDGTPADGQTVIFEFGGQTVTITAADTPDDSGVQIPTFLTGSEDDYMALVVEYLRRNDALMEEFSAEIDGTGTSIYLIRRTFASLAMTLSGTADANVFMDVVAGSASFAQPNLTALVKVIELSDGQENTIVSLQAPYEANTRTVDFDLNGLFDFLNPALPTPASINPTIGSLLNGLTSGSVALAKLRYADRYGLDPVAEALLPSSVFRVIHGALSTDTTGDFPYDEDMWLAHNYRIRDTSEIFWKPIAPDQPDWLYFWSNTAENVTWRFRLVWSDGQETMHNPTSTGLSIEANQLRWVQAGFTQAQLAGVTPPDPGLEIVRYELQIRKLVGDRILARAYYELGCECHPWSMFLLVDNGLGGMETVWLKGKSTWKYQVERDEIQLTPIGENTLSSGTLDSFLATGRHLIDVSTGWHDRFYIEHLRQVLLGKTWIVDVKNSRFIRVVVDTKSLDVTEDDQDLFALSFGLKYAVEERAFNNF